MPLQHADVILVPELKTRQRDAMTSDQLWRAAGLAGIDPEAASAETVWAGAGAFRHSDRPACDTMLGAPETAIWSRPVLTGETPPNGSGK